jgi:hypothetical protein
MVTLLREHGTDAGHLAELTLEPMADGRLLASRHGATRPVTVRLTFPWTEPSRLVSLRDDEDAEFALVRDAAELSEASRRALERALAQAGFVLAVTRVLAVEEEVEVRHWKVETRQGPRVFQTRLDDWPRALPKGGLLIRDVCGDLYHIPDTGALDRRSRELLWAFVD